MDREGGGIEEVYRRVDEQRKEGVRGGGGQGQGVVIWMPPLPPPSPYPLPVITEGQFEVTAATVLAAS